jgi:hypothetical protein
MEHPNDAHLRRQVEDTADALAYAMQASAPERDRANDEAAFERAVTTAAALLHGEGQRIRRILYLPAKVRVVWVFHGGLVPCWLV